MNTMHPEDLFLAFGDGFTNALDEDDIGPEMRQMMQRSMQRFFMEAVTSSGNVDIGTMFDDVMHESMQSPAQDIRRHCELTCPTCQKVHFPVEGTKKIEIAMANANATGMTNQNRRSTRHNDAADVVSESSDDSSMPILEDPAGADDGSSSSSESSSEDLFDNSSDDSREGFFPVVTFRVNTESNRSDDESSMPPLDIDEAIADRETNDELDGPPVNVESDSSDYDSSDISSMPLLEDIDNGAIAMNDVEAMTTTETNDEMNGPLESITVQLPIDEDGDDESMPGMDDKVYIITQSGIILPKDENDDVESIESIDSSYDSGDDSDVSNFSFHTQPPEESGSISSASDPEQEESGIRNPSNSADHQSTSPLTHLCDFGVMCVFATGICPVCLEECTPVIALPCGHVLCEEDYKRMGGYRSSA